MKGKRAGMIQPKNKVYSGIFFLSLGKQTIAVIVFKLNSEIGRRLVVYYLGIVIKITSYMYDCKEQPALRDK